MTTWERTVTITKLDTEQQLVFGFLSVSTDEAGKLIIDSQGDYILPEDLEKAAYAFVKDSRGTGLMHQVMGIGTVVESFVLTKEKTKLLGIHGPTLPECGWWVGLHVSDPQVWNMVKSGELRAFSIGGTGRRVLNPEGVK